MSAPTAPAGLVARLARHGDVFWYTGLNYAGVGISGLSSVLVVRAIGAGGAGGLAAIAATVPFLTLALTLGLPTSLRQGAALDASRIPALRAIARRHAWHVTALSIPLGTAISFALLSSFGVSTRVAGAVVLAGSALGAYTESCGQILVGRGESKRYGVYVFIPVAASACLTIALAVAHLLTVTTAIAILAIRPVAQLAVVRRVLAPAGATNDPILPHLAFGARGLLANFAETGTNRLDQLLLLPLIGSVALGRYSTCVTIAVLPIALTQALLARHFRRMAVDRGETTRTALRRVAVISGATALVAVPIALAAPYALPFLYGPAFDGLGPVIALLLAGTVILAGGYTASWTITAKGRPGLTTAGWLVGLVVTVIAIGPASRAHGVLGAAGVATASYAAVLLVMVAAVVRVTGAPGSTNLPVDHIAPSPSVTPGSTP